MNSRFALGDKRVRLWLGVILPAAVLAILFAYRATVHAQSADQLTVYSPQTSYSVPVLNMQGVPYVGLIELLEPLGSVEGRVDGRNTKPRFTPPGGQRGGSAIQRGQGQVEDPRREL